MTGHESRAQGCALRCRLGGRLELHRQRKSPASAGWY